MFQRSKRRLLLFLALLVVFAMGTITYSATEPITFKLGHVYAPDHPFSKGMVKLAANVKKRSKGRLVINVYDSGTLGSEKDLADGLINGFVDMAIVGPGELGKRFKPILIFDGPYVFRNVEHMSKVTGGPVGQKLFEEMEKKIGIHELVVIYYGARYVTTSKFLIKTPADMKGIKIRTPDQPLSVANIKAMGANPTPMALSEVYLALQQGVVDGQENPIPTIASQKFNEVQKYIILTGHVTQCSPVVVSARKLASLSASLRKILIAETNKVGPAINQEIIKQEKSLLSEFQKGGMTVIKPDIKAFRKAAYSVIKQFENTWGPGLYEKIQGVK
jgi:tripartite ATP-independent transporter DctP family solute receptor